LNPDQLLNQAKSLQKAGRLQEATIAFEKLRTLYPKFTPILNDLGILYLQQERLKEGMELLEKSLRIDPKQPLISFNLGRAYQAQEKFKEAAHAFHQTRKLKPEFTDAYFNEAYALFCLEQFDEALVLFHHVASLSPNSAHAINALGISLYHSGKYEEALRQLKTALNLNITSPEIHNNIGLALHKLNCFEDAIEHYSKAIALNPMYADAISNRGLTFQSMRKVNDALKDFNNAISINPSHADAQWNKSLLEIMIGNFKEGWLRYEWRWQSFSKKWSRHYDKPLWLGKESLQGKSILIYPEQGYGDFIQFYRYIDKLLLLGSKVILETPEPLIALIAESSNMVEIIESGKKLPNFDFQCPIMSLPLAFKTNLENLPCETPYIRTSPQKLKLWVDKLGVKSKKRIGVAWSGSKEHKNDHNRSIALIELSALLEMPFEFHSLQKEIRDSDQDFFDRSSIINHQNDIKDFSDTAALIETMDLVISVDTSIAHLAGSLNKSLLLLLPFNADYRWMHYRLDSPWYPSATLLRQSEFGKWNEVIEDLKKLCLDS